MLCFSVAEGRRRRVRLDALKVLCCEEPTWMKSRSGCCGGMLGMSRLLRDGVHKHPLPCRMDDQVQSTLSALVHTVQHAA